VTRLSHAPQRHDPYWDLDGSSVRKARVQRRAIRRILTLLGIVLIVIVVSHLPAVDPSVLTSPEGRPLLAGALLCLLGVSVMLALARMRYVSRH
jgi:drug/metabolite transporter superfamily protein YnfA